MITTVMEKMIDYFKNDVRRINHALKVLTFAHIISQEELADEKIHQILCFTAILHDIGIKEAERKYHSSGAKYQEIEGPHIARHILTQLDISQGYIERICFIIGNHHSYAQIDGMDFQMLVEADFLVNMYEDSMNQDTIRNIRDTIFKTKSGKRLLESMYLEEESGVKRHE